MKINDALKFKHTAFPYQKKKKKKRWMAKSIAKQSLFFSIKFTTALWWNTLYTECSVSIMSTLNLIFLGISSFSFMLFPQVTCSSSLELIKCNTEKNVR